MESFKLSPCGRWMGLKGSGRKGGGVINVLNAETCQWVAEVRVEGRGGVADFDWWGNGDGMVVLGKGGEAVEWDGKQHRVVARWVDEGAVGTTVVALGGRGGGDERLGGDRWIAIGSSSGIVNVYDRKAWGNPAASATQAGGVADIDIDVNIPPRPKPARALDHLTTPTSSLAFSPDGQILAMASQWKRDALRLGECLFSICNFYPARSSPFLVIRSIMCPSSPILSHPHRERSPPPPKKTTLHPPPHPRPRLPPNSSILYGLTPVPCNIIIIKPPPFIHPNFANSHAHVSIYVYLVHLPTISVYRNWPTSATPLGRVTAIAFAPPGVGAGVSGSGGGGGGGGGGLNVGVVDTATDLLAIANEQGKIRLWEIRGV